ncbi:MAG TPA: LysM peptidoglycan-binding domain-containing protein, partial [Usitatibacter sp.]|nr:LysM peptidoglycan-binding domain-containing protein [Usitatibacter sp.]
HNKPVAVGSGGMNSLVLPLDKAEAFRTNLDAYDKPLVTWTQYQAKRGESIDAIAKRHGLTGAQLRAANDTLKLDKRGRLRVAGAVIVPIKGSAASNIGVAAMPALPVPVAKQPARLSVSTPTASSAGTPRAAPKTAAASAKTYVVRAGDTLYGIAQRFNIAVDALRAANRLAANAVIKPGLRLQLP